MSKKFKLLIFDWDGTLMDSQGRIVASFQSAIAELELPERQPTQIRSLIGLGLEKVVATLFPQATDQQHIQLMDCYRHHFWNTHMEPSLLFPGVAETLHDLYAMGYWLAVATGKSRRGLNQALAENNLVPVFHSSRCAEETCSKPHPQMLQEIMMELNISHVDTLMIGDTEYDLQMANNAGVASVAVSYGMHEPARLLACQPLICLDSLPALLTWLQA